MFPLTTFLSSYYPHSQKSFLFIVFHILFVNVFLISPIKLLQSTFSKPVYILYSQRQSVDAGCEGSLLGEGVADEPVEQRAHQPHH